MGRELMRVPLDFDWPVGKIWAGYIANEYDYEGELIGEDKDYEPPAGDGYQMWENVSEGSPISPVFETPEELADWLGENCSEDGTRNDWYLMITNGGYSPSLVIIAGQIFTGVEVVAQHAREKMGRSNETL